MAFDIFRGKTIFLTGHTGFKGAWLSIWLHSLGAKVVGYSNELLYPQSLFEIAKLDKKITDIRADVGDFSVLEAAYRKHKPDIVFHLAAQSLVKASYEYPRETFETNVMGTANMLELVRKNPPKAAVFITSDKCYRNIEQAKGYVETDSMSDADPYSCSKGCAEMVAQSYRTSFGVKVATTRAGNVIGGGDWAKNRLIPDIMRSLEAKEPILIRNPTAVRPWQFVLEPLSGYLLLAQMQLEGKEVNSGWNFGPKRSSMIPVKDVVNIILKEWGSGEMVVKPDPSQHEANLLFLDINKAQKKLGWNPKLDIRDALKYTIAWYRSYRKKDPYAICTEQIAEYAR